MKERHKHRLVIPVERGLSKDSILEVLADNSDVEGFLVGDVSRHDMRAGYCEESFRILSVNRGQGRGAFELEFSYEWTAYYGCRDMCKGNTECDSASFRYWGGSLIFETNAPTSDANNKA